MLLLLLFSSSVDVTSSSSSSPPPSTSFSFPLPIPIGIVKLGFNRNPLIRNPVEGVIYFRNPNCFDGFCAFVQQLFRFRFLLEGSLSLLSTLLLNFPSSNDCRTFDVIPSAPTHKSAIMKLLLLLLLLTSSLSSMTTLTRSLLSVGSTFLQLTP